MGRIISLAKQVASRDDRAAVRAGYYEISYPIVLQAFSVGYG